MSQQEPLPADHGRVEEPAADAPVMNPFQTLIEHSPDIMWIIDRNGRVNFMSPALTARLGWTPGTLVGARADILIPPEELDLYNGIVNSITEKPGASTTVEMQLLRSNGSKCWVSGAITNLNHYPSLNGLVFSVRDIDQRRLYEEGLIGRSFFDALTGLPTRVLFVDRLDQAIALASNERIVKALYIDIDNFGTINRQLGFGPADDLLRQASERLTQMMPRNAIIGRFRNDEFLVAQVSSESNRGELVSAVTKAFGEPFKLGGKSVGASASVGLTTTTRSDLSAKELIDQAATAAYEAKRHGNGQAVTYTEALHRRSVFKRETESQLMNAVVNGELRLHYQPVMDAHTTLAVGLEALVRWEHPTRGLIPPSEFITIAEETGMIVDIGYWVIDQTVQLVSDLNRDWKGRPLFAAINMSPRQLSDHRLIQRTQMAINRSGLAPQLLHLDITEESLQGSNTRIGHQLQRLNQLGIELAIDNFGTGETSLNLLREAPATYLKVDRSFTSQIATGGLGIVTGIVALAHSLGLVPMAEGIETEHQLEVLKDLGCPYSQGYYHARPLPREQLIEFLADNFLQTV